MVTETFARYLDDNDIKYKIVRGNIIVLENFDLYEYTPQIPDNTIFKNNFLVRATVDTYTLPIHMEVGLSFIISSRSKLRYIPKYLVCKNLHIMNGHIKTIPSTITVRGVLDLSGSDVSIIRDGICVGSHLNAQFTNMKYLPVYGTIWGDLNLSYTSVDYIPPLLYIDGEISTNKIGYTDLYLYNHVRINGYVNDNGIIS